MLRRRGGGYKTSVHPAPFLVTDFSEQTGHVNLCVGVILFLLNLPFELLLRLFLPLAESELKEVLRPSLLCRLLLKDVLQQVFVPLDKPLRIDLPVLHLLLPITLDPFEQGLQTLLLLLPQLVHFLHQGHLQILTLHLSLVPLLLLDHHPHGLGLVVVLDCEVNLLLFAHFNKVLASTLLVQEVFLDLLLLKHQFLLLLDLELLDQLESCLLVVSHVLVPRI